jgi:hypothetical protein
MAFIGNTPTTQAFTPAIDYFSGNGSTTAFTLSRPVASVAQVQVVIDNVAQNPSSAYTVSSNTITFTSAPLSGTNNIYVYYTSPITQVIAPGQSTVGLTAFSATGTPSASTYLRGDNSWAAVSVSPGGSTTQLQYNNAGAFGGISGVTTDGTRMTASTTIGVGAATPSTSGSGITFPATQSASSNANTLDDYEEGSFTPTITGDGFTRTYNGSYTAGRYTKIGRSVTIEVAMYVPTQTGTYNGQAPEFNLPFPSSSFVGAQHWSLTVLRLATVPAAMLAQVPVLNAMSDTTSLRGYLSRTTGGTSTSNAWDMTTMGVDYQMGYTLTYITST